MAEMNRISRFFVNTLTGRRNARTHAWLAANLRLPEGAACLEIGCGNGDMARRIVDGQHPARYVATDLDPRQLEAARRHLASWYENGLPRSLELRAVDMLALPFPDASFDAVLAFYSLHHADAVHGAWVNVPRALAEADRVLRPGGRLAYTEIVNRERVRAWLAERGYRLESVVSGWHREAVLAAKPPERPSGTIPAEA